MALKYVCFPIQQKAEDNILLDIIRKISSNVHENLLNRMKVN